MMPGFATLYPTYQLVGASAKALVSEQSTRTTEISTALIKFMGHYNMVPKKSNTDKAMKGRAVRYQTLPAGTLFITSALNCSISDVPFVRPLIASQRVSTSGRTLKTIMD
jgi:hypothetical protein